jgi:hypothetical protein
VWLNSNFNHTSKGIDWIELTISSFSSHSSNPPMFFLSEWIEERCRVGLVTNNHVPVASSSNPKYSRMLEEYRRLHLLYISPT